MIQGFYRDYIGVLPRINGKENRQYTGSYYVYIYIYIEEHVGIMCGYYPQIMENRMEKIIEDEMEAIIDVYVYIYIYTYRVVWG